MISKEIQTELARLERFEEVLLELVKREQMNPSSRLNLYDFPLIQAFIKRSIQSDLEYLFNHPDEFKELYLKEYLEN